MRIAIASDHAALALKAEMDALPSVDATVPLLEQLAGHYAG